MTGGRGINFEFNLCDVIYEWSLTVVGQPVWYLIDLEAKILTKLSKFYFDTLNFLFSTDSNRTKKCFR